MRTVQDKSRSPELVWLFEDDAQGFGKARQRTPWFSRSSRAREDSR
jgi:hypothetical protein